MQAAFVIFLSLGRIASAQRNFRDILSSLTVELGEKEPRTTETAVIANTKADSTRAASTTEQPLGLGLPCAIDDQCMVAQGLSCQEWVCACAPTTPIKVEVLGEPRCVPARSLYQPCRFHQECNHTSGPMRCVERLCLCPAPFELNRVGACIEPGPTLKARLMDAATPAVMSVVFVTSVLSAFLILRMLPCSRSDSDNFTANYELCSAQARPSRKRASAASGGSVPVRQMLPPRALPIRRIRMPPAKKPGETPVSAARTSSEGPSQASSVTAVAPNTSPVSTPPDESQLEESRSSGTLHSDDAHYSSNDVPITSSQVTHDIASFSASSTPEGATAMAGAIGRPPLKTNMSVQWLSVHSRAPSSSRGDTAAQMPHKSALAHPKAKTSKEVPSRLLSTASSGRRRTVAFVDVLLESDESSSGTKLTCGEDERQGSTTVETRWLSQSIRGPIEADRGALDETFQGAQEAGGTEKRVISNTSVCAKKHSGTKPPYDDQECLADAPLVPSTASFEAEIPPDLIESHITCSAVDSDFAEGPNTGGHLKRKDVLPVIAEQPRRQPFPPVPLIRRRIGLTGQTSCEAAATKAAGASPDPEDTGSVSQKASETGAQFPNIVTLSEVDNDAEHLKQLIRVKSRDFYAKSPTSDNGSQARGGRALKMSGAAKGYRRSFSHRLAAQGDDVSGRRLDAFPFRPAVVASSDSEVDNLSNQGYPPALSRRAWGSVTELPFAGETETQDVADWASLSQNNMPNADYLSAGRDVPPSVDFFHRALSPSGAHPPTPAVVHPIPLKRSVKFRRTDFRQLQEVTEACRSDEVRPPLSLRAPSCGEGQNSLRRPKQDDAADAFSERKSSTSVAMSSSLHHGKNKASTQDALLGSSVLLVQGPATSGLDLAVSHSYTAASSSASSSSIIMTPCGYRLKRAKAQRECYARRQFSEPFPGQRLSVIHELNSESDRTSCDSSVSTSSASARDEDVSKTDTRLTWSSPALVVSTSESPSRTVEMRDVSDNKTCVVNHDEAINCSACMSAVRTSHSKQARLPASYGEKHDVGSCEEENQCLQPVPNRYIADAPSPAPRKLKNVVNPTCILGNDHANAHGSNELVNTISNQDSLRNWAIGSELVDEPEAAPTISASVKPHRGESGKQRIQSSVLATPELYSMDEKEQCFSSQSFQRMSVPCAPSTVPTVARSATFTLSNAAASSGSYDLFPPTFQDAVVATASATSLSPRSTSESSTLKNRSKQPTRRTFMGRRSASTETASLSIRTEPNRRQRVSALLASMVRAGTPGHGRRNTRRVGANTNPSVTNDTRQTRSDCFDVEMLSSSSAPPREQPESSTSFSVLGSRQSLTVLEPSAVAHFPPAPEDYKGNESTLRSSLRERAVRSCMSMPFSRARMPSSECVWRSCSSDPPERQRPSGDRFGNPDCST